MNSAAEICSNSILFSFQWFSKLISHQVSQPQLIIIITLISQSLCWHMRYCLIVCFHIHPHHFGSKSYSRTTKPQWMYNHTPKPSFLETDFQARTCDQPNCWAPLVLQMTTCLSLLLSDKAHNLLTNILQSLLDRPTAQLGPHLWHTLFCCQHSALSCWRILRWHNSNLISPAFTECAVIVPDAREKIWKFRVYKYEREDGEFRVKRFFILTPDFQKRK